MRVILFEVQPLGWRSLAEGTWRLLTLEFDDPHFNMAVEEAVATKVGEYAAPNTIRFWRSPNSVVVGCFQAVTLEVNFEECKKHGTKIVRRFTGGGAVYHDWGNLNYAVSICKGDSLIQRNSFDTYIVLSRSVVSSLESLGIPAHAASPNCIEVSGGKVSGAAGSMRGGSVFYHGSILVNSDLALLSRVLNTAANEPEIRGVRSVPKKVTTLTTELGRTLDMSEMKKALWRGFELTCGVNLVEGELSPEETELARTLFRTKYATDDWNLYGHEPD